MLANLSASDETVGKAEYRRQLVGQQSARLLSAYLYADAGHGESTTDMVFAGHDLVFENGSLLAEAKPFSGTEAEAEIDVSFLAAERRRLGSFVSAATADGYAVTESTFTGAGELSLRKVPRLPFVPAESGKLGERAELILTMQAHALAKLLGHTAAKTAVVGISGGLDSSLALLVTARAFELLGKDKKEIVAVTMPGGKNLSKFFETHRMRGGERPHDQYFKKRFAALRRYLSRQNASRRDL